MNDTSFPSATFSGSGLACVRGGRLVFRHLNFTVNSGDALVLTGTNGAGKSSLLRLMAGLLRPAIGHLQWDGQPMASVLPHEGRVCYVGHADAVKPVLTAWESVQFLAAMHGANPSPDILNAFDIARLAAVPGRMLSAGQKRRVALTRLLAAPTPLWLLDEPATALDRASVGRLEGLIARHRAQSGMVVLSSHGGIDIPGAASLDLGAFQPKALEAMAW